MLAALEMFYARLLVCLDREQVIAVLAAAPLIRKVVNPIASRAVRALAGRDKLGVSSIWLRGSVDRRGVVA